MGGAQICLLRLLRLKEVLQEVVNSKQFLDLKLHKDVAYIIKLDAFWDLVEAFCRCFYAPMRLLRLCDMKTAVMDKLKYYTIQTGVMIDQYVGDLGAKWYKFCTPYVRNILNPDSLMRTANPSMFDEPNETATSKLEDNDDGDDDDSLESGVFDDELVESDDEQTEEEAPVLLCDMIRAAWNKRKVKLLHDYARAGYILSPDPVIMAHHLTNPDPEDKNACERLIIKLFVPVHVVGEARDVLSGSLIDSFHDEWDQFTTRSGDIYSKNYIWITASNSATIAHEWHNRYSTGTRILGKLACHVTSKIGGIGNAERSWKAVKATKRGRYTLSNESTKKQATIAGNYMAQRNDKERVLSQKAGTLWEERDFHTLKLTKHCLPLAPAPPVTGTQQDGGTSSGAVRIFRAWCEKWENKKLKKSGDTVLEARLVNKYGGLKWIDADQEEQPVVTAHPDKMHFVSERGNHRYNVLAMNEGFDVTKHEDDQDEEIWESWEKGYDLYGQIVEYYEENPDPKIIIYKEGECLSDDEVEHAPKTKSVAPMC
jgi:hypothetical protein